MSLTTRDIARAARVTKQQVRYAAEAGNMDIVRHVGGGWMNPHNSFTFTREQGFQLLLTFELRRRLRRNGTAVQGILESIDLELACSKARTSPELYLITDGKKARILASTTAVVETMKNLDVGVHVIDLVAIWLKVQPKTKAAAA